VTTVREVNVSFRFLLAGFVGLSTARLAHAGPSVSVSRVSGESPFAPGFCGTDPSQHGLEIDPTFAVTRDGLVAAWEQDSAATSPGAVTAHSTDGGVTWTQSVPPAPSICDLGGVSALSAGVFEPRLAANASGRAFLVAGDDMGQISQVSANSSSDGGVMWSAPTGFIAAVASDYPTISADPSNDQTAAIVWPERGLDSTWFAQTTDGGATWSLARPIRVTPVGAICRNGLITLPDSTLVDVVTDNPFLSGALGGPDVTGFGLHIHAYRSTDHGSTWSESTIVDLKTSVAPDDVGVPADPIVGPDGAANVLIPDRDSGPTVWKLFRSVDGAIWSQYATVPLRDGALIPAVGITPTGTIGVLYDVTEADRKTTDVWLAYSGDDGATWGELHLGGPFDLSAVPGGSVGDYQELHPVGADLGAIFMLGPCLQQPTDTCPAQTEGPTDVYFARISF